MARISALRLSTAALALAVGGISNAAWAACDNKTPAAGASVTCDPNAPNPDTGGILSALESTNPNNITLNVQASSTISGIYLGTGATVNLVAGSSVTGTSTGANRAIDVAGGNLTISGAVASPGAAAILLGTASGSRVTLNSGGTVTSNGGAGAIVANGDGGFFTINGTVVTNGDYFNPTGTGASVVNLSNNFITTVGSTGSITTNGARTVGLVTRGTGSSLSVAGSITANGANSAAISLIRNGGTTLTNTLTLATDGTALATGATSNAIFAADAAQIDIAGTARTTGISSTALNLSNTLSGTVINVAGTGRLVSEGGGRGIWVTNNPATITVASGGFVGDTSGVSGSNGIVLNTTAALGNSTLTNSGTISVTSGTAILANGGGINLNNLAAFIH
ncbi:MAG: hypothetical protein IT552_09120 [Sphingomonadaceae bacterium]|nr:hypothetical protein [Sphingomonadaceae bacterium]